MMRFIVLLFTALFGLAAGCKEEKPRLVLLDVKELSYPSGSAIVYHEGKYYVMGDDAPALLIMDSSWKQADTINIDTSAQHRIPKKIKHDLEAGTWFNDKNESSLILLGSGSKPPHRSSGWIIDPETRRRRTFSLDTFYSRLAEAGVNQLNVEAITQLPGWYVIGCRGNMKYRKNHLVFAENRFWNAQPETRFRLATLGGNVQGETFRGLSGLAYSYRSDVLFMTASTEHTSSTSSDGKIGKSFLWILPQANRIVNYAAVNPAEIIDLELADPRFAGSKIESVSVVSEGRRQTTLVLVADNDDGKTTVFKVLVNHKKAGKH